MSRIRSIHPGLFTDEAFLQLSDAAKVLWIGLWTEADDQGVFEWKPITLRVKLRPVSDTAVEPLLGELEALDCIKKFEHDGRIYGAVRNFRRFQRPKKPTYQYPLPHQFRTYVGLDAAGSEPEPFNDPPSGEPERDESSPVPHQFPTSSEPVGESLSRWRMEDGVGEESSVQPTGVVVALSRSDAPRGARLGADWDPGPDGRRFAAELGLDARAVLAQFRDYWVAQPGAKGRKADWQATWRNWCRKDAGRSGARAPTPEPRSPSNPTGRPVSPMSGGL